MSKRKKNSKKTTCRKQHQKHGLTPDTSSENSTWLRFINAFKKPKKMLKGQNAQTDIPSPGSQPPSPGSQPPSPGSQPPSPGPLVPYTSSDESQGCSDQLFGPRCSTPSKAMVVTSAFLNLTQTSHSSQIQSRTIPQSVLSNLNSSSNHHQHCQCQNINPTFNL